MKSLIKMFVSASLVIAVIVGSLGVAASQTACTASTCSSSEEKACTDTYTTCVNEAAAAADTNKCTQCVDNYCKCYDACGNSCDRDKLNGSCSQAKAPDGVSATGTD